MSSKYIRKTPKQVQQDLIRLIKKENENLKIPTEKEVQDYINNKANIPPEDLINTKLISNNN
jgi:hypothetical protein